MKSPYSLQHDNTQTSWFMILDIKLERLVIIQIVEIVI